jgi:hypothetical protein
MRDRDDFSEPVKRTLAERAAYMCSNDTCRTLTVMPSSEPEKSVKTGRAAHICAAASGGPRFEPTQSPNERSSIHNAIHLCATCADIIDKDERNYPAERLRQMKRQHEEWVTRADITPAPPRVSIETQDGLLLGPQPGEVTGEMVAQLRDHLMTIETGSRHELLDLELRAQFPEAVVKPRRLDGVASQVSVVRDETRWHVTANVGGSVKFSGSPGPTPLFIIRIDVLRAGRPVEILLRCVPDRAMDTTLYGPDAVFHYVEGKYLYRHRGQVFERHWGDEFLMDAQRRIVCQPITRPVNLIEQKRL